jgi:hypothetical protein
MEFMMNVKIEKAGAGVFMVKINAANRGAADKELKILLQADRLPSTSIILIPIVR